MARVERILFVVAIVALGWYASARASVMLYQASQNRQLEELRLERSDVPLPADSPAVMADSPGRAELPGSREAPPAAAPSAETRARKAEPSRRADTRGLIGRIDIPRLGVSAIVRKGVDDRTLRRAVGHVPETALPGEAGNVALAGHRDTFFGPLRRVREGDRIRLRTPDGDFNYVVRESRIVEPTDLSVLAPTSGATLTLITCYPFNYVGPAPQRFIVRAEAADR